MVCMKFKIARYFRSFDVVEVEAPSFSEACRLVDDGHGNILEEGVFNDWMPTESWTGEDEEGNFYD